MVHGIDDRFFCEAFEKGVFELVEAYGVAISEKFEKAYPEAFKANVHTPPMGHFGDNEKEIGRVVVQLTSPDFKYMTGETITLEGGLGMRP